MKSKWKKFPLAALAIIMMIVALTGCLPTQSPTTAVETEVENVQPQGTEEAVEEPVDAEQVTVRMWTFLDPNADNGRSRALKTIIENFEAENPNIKILVEPQDYQTMTAKFLAATSNNSAPDIIWAAQDEIGGVLDAGALEPFENLFLKDWTEEEIADIDDAQWSFAMRDGKHYQVTLSKNINTIYYRADLFEEYGIEEPKTWDELVAAAQTLTGVDEETGIMRYGLGQSFTTDHSDAQIISNMIFAEQGSPLGEDGKANWTTEVAEKALQWEVDTMKTWKITPETAVTTTNDDLFNEFAAGKYAMIVGGAVRVPNVKAASTFDPDAVQIMLMPSFDGTTYSPSLLAGWSVAVWSGSPVKEEAGKFVEAMISPEADALWVEVGGQAPVRKTTVESLADFLNTPQNEYLKVMSEGFNVAGWVQPTDVKIAGWRFDLNKSVQNVVVDGMTIEDALAATAQEFNSRNGY